MCILALGVFLRSSFSFFLPVFLFLALSLSLYTQTRTDMHVHTRALTHTGQQISVSQFREYSSLDTFQLQGVKLLTEALHNLKSMLWGFDSAVQ